MNKNQKILPYVSSVKKYVKQKRIPFHMPGHKQGNGINKILRNLWGNKIFQYDLTEVDGLDYLNDPSGVIAKAEELAAQAFGVENTLFLVNGSTLGNQVAMLSLIKEKDKIVISRNAHQSTLSALILSGAYPIYIQPTYHGSSGLYPVTGYTSVKQTLQKNPGVKAVHITSPTHIGFTSDIGKIASITKSMNIPLIVDEAHGAHFQFHPDLPKSAINFDADLVVQSTHKTLGSLTQTSMLHLVKSRHVSIDKLQNTTMLLQSSSPSTLFIMSLDAARQQMAMNGLSMLTTTLKLARLARKSINNMKGFYCYGKEVIGKDDIADMDETKLLIDVSNTGYTGYELEKVLSRKYNVEIEMSDAKHILCFVTIGDSKKSIEKLLFALNDIANKPTTLIRNRKSLFLPIPPIPELLFSPRDAFFADKETVSFSQALGKVSGEFIIPFPPDIPIIAPGERINKDIIEYVKFLKKTGTMVIGIKDKSLETVQVIKK